jgi:excisionase family DNA binding protein
MDEITVNEAAKLSGYNAVHLRRLFRSGEVKARKFGETWMVDKDSLMEYLKRTKRGPKKRFDK